MFARIYPLLVVLFWLATMSWLVASKILPPLIGGQRPDYSGPLMVEEERTAPVTWRISWNNRRIGVATSQALRRASGGTALRHVVHFERMPLQAMLSESFGLLGSAMKPLLGGDSQLELEMLLATELRFDSKQQFTDFQTKADLATLKDFVRIRGHLDQNHNLQVTSRFGPAVGLEANQQELRHEIPLPRESLVGDAFAPRSELRKLQVGQKWTMPVYRPFPPNSPVQIIEAVAERLDVIVWDGHDTETILVVYREEAGTGLHAAREPVAREWVRLDGTVVQHEIRVSGLTVLFERLPNKTYEMVLEMLDEDKHPRLWSP